jgi:serine protease
MIRNTLVLVLISALVLGCTTGKKSPPDEVAGTAAAASVGGAKASSIRPASGAVPATDESLMEAQEAAVLNARLDREKWRKLGFEEFQRQTFREPGENGKYIVNGDTPIRDAEALRRFYDENIAKEPEATSIIELIVATEAGRDLLWSNAEKRKLTYCVSRAFGPRHAAVVAAMSAAGRRWAEFADVRFIHVPAEDARCDEKNARVLFDVRPVDVWGEYFARAFFPNEPRVARNVLIDDSSFTLPPGKLTLVGILRHELGHVLGMRHEHTRPESGACFEDMNWRPLTNNDPFSVMHYPQCNGAGDWSLDLSTADKSGIACAYGASATFEPNPAICTPRVRR